MVFGGDTAQPPKIEPRENGAGEIPVILINGAPSNAKLFCRERDFCASRAKLSVAYPSRGWPRSHHTSSRRSKTSENSTVEPPLPGRVAAAAKRRN